MLHDQVWVCGASVLVGALIVAPGFHAVSAFLKRRFQTAASSGSVSCAHSKPVSSFSRARQGEEKREEEILDGCAIDAGKLSAKVDPLMREQLSRNITFLGEESFNKLVDAFVVVVGVGGVGSHAAEMLVRSGVRRIRLIDFDQVTLSSLNRHAVARRADVGTPKVVTMRKHLQEIVGAWAEVEARVQLFDAEHAEDLLSGSPDFVLDCIDNRETKLQLLTFCHQRKIRVISSMGAGGRADPSKIFLGDISSTGEEPLACRMRKDLKTLGIRKGIPVVWSAEKNSANLKLRELSEEQKANREAYKTFSYMRIRILPVLGTLPAIFGQMMASYVVLALTGTPPPLNSTPPRPRLYEQLRCKLVSRELSCFGQEGGQLGVTVRDVEVLVEEVFEGKSAVSGRFNSLVLTRWDRQLPPSRGNLVLLTGDECKRHDKLHCEEERQQAYGVHTCDRISTLLQKCQADWEQAQAIRHLLLS